MNEQEQCPHQNKLREDLPPLTLRLSKLPVDERGYPVPRFVQWLDAENKPTRFGVGRPEFRIASSEHWKDCVTFNFCWVCGETLGKHRASVIGPMCAVNLTSAEPPSHVDCAEWSVKGCPFLAKPQMKRRQDEFTKTTALANPPAGYMIERNPGVIMIWHTTEPNQLFRDGKGGWLFRLPSKPLSVRCFTLGRPATQQEVVYSIQQGLPQLLSLADTIEERNLIHARVERVVMTL